VDPLVSVWNVYLPAGTDWCEFKAGEKLYGDQNIRAPAEGVQTLIGITERNFTKVNFMIDGVRD